MDKILALLGKTQDTVIWPHDNQLFAVMPIEKYYNLLGQQDCVNLGDLSEEQMIGKINKDIAEWRLKQVENSDFLSEFSGNQADEAEPGEETEDQYYLEPVD